MLVQIATLWSPTTETDAGTTLGQPPADPNVGSGSAAITVRPARISDMGAVESLIRDFSVQALMLPKTQDQLARSFREFVVATDADGRVVGCGALRVFTADLAEITSLAVDRSKHRQGIGRRLVERLIVEAYALDIRTVFALTLRPEFFRQMGFRVVPKEDFPLKVWADCRGCPKLLACDEIAVALELGPGR